MENASKALVIAGSVLLAMITISLFYYMFSHISEFQSITQEDTGQKALLAFNEGFEAYNKKVMYGSDVISVINKALDNNKRYNIENERNDGYYVDVTFIINEDLATRTEYYVKNGNSYTKYDDRTVATGEIRGGQQYSIRNNYTLGNNTSGIINQLTSTVSFKNGIDQTAEHSITYMGNPARGYEITYYPVAEFKRKMFRCTGIIEYHNNGRVHRINFTER